MSSAVRVPVSSFVLCAIAVLLVGGLGAAPCPLTYSTTYTGTALAQHPSLEVIYFSASDTVGSQDYLYTLTLIAGTYTFSGSPLVSSVYALSFSLVPSPDGVDIYQVLQGYMRRRLLDSGGLPLDPQIAMDAAGFNAASVSPDGTVFLEPFVLTIAVWQRNPDGTWGGWTNVGSTYPITSIVWASSVTVFLASNAFGSEILRFQKTAPTVLTQEVSYPLGTTEKTLKLISSGDLGGYYYVTALIQYDTIFYHVVTFQSETSPVTLDLLADISCTTVGSCETSTDMVVSPDNQYLYVLTTTSLIMYEFNTKIPLNPSVIYPIGGIEMEISHNGLYFVILDQSTLTVLDRDITGGYVVCGPTTSPTSSPTMSITATMSMTPTISITPTITPSISITPTTTTSATPTISITATASITPSISITPTTTASITPTISITPTSSITPTISITPSVSMTPTISVSSTISITASASNTPTVSITPSTSETPSVSATVTTSISETRTASQTPSETPSISETATTTTTATPTPTVTPTPTISETASPKPTPTEECKMICNDVCVSSTEECIQQSNPGTKLVNLFTDNGEVVVTRDIAKELGKGVDSVKVVPVTVEILKNSDTVVPLMGAAGGDATIGYGTVNIPKNTFPKGWTVTITPASKESVSKTSKNDGSDCGDSSSSSSNTASVNSLAFNLEVYDEKGKKQKVQDLEGTGIEFEMIVTLPESLSDQVKDLDFSFINDGDEVWQSLGKTVIKPVKKSSTIRSPDGEKLLLWSVSSATSHLTSFAVLLGSASAGGCGSSRVLWIISIALLATAIVFTILVGAVSPYFRWFRMLFYGYDRHLEMKRIGMNSREVEPQV